MAAILGIFGICLLFSGVQETSSVMNVEIPQKVYKIARGDNVTIPCQFSIQAAEADVQISWTASPDVQGDPAIGIVTYRSSTKFAKVQTKYKGRVMLLQDISKGKADLQLLRVTNTDTRSYECRVEVLNNDEDGVSKTTNLIVLVAPSPPICKIQGVSEYYQDIKLTCLSEEGTPTPTYRWQRHNTNNIPQPNPPKATDIQGVLSLFNITIETSGFYICTSTNEIRSATCNLTLAVMALAPSLPICKIQGVSEYYQDIKLTCLSEEGTPTPTYRWQRHNTNNIPQPNPPKATDILGVLSLFNITIETSGFYICTSTNEIRSATCNLTLAVMPPSMSMASIGWIIGVIVGVVLIFGIIIICCCYCRRKKEKAEEYRMGTPEGGEFTDKDPEGKGDGHDEHVSYEEERRVKSANRHDPQDDRSERSYDRSERSYDRRSDYTDRRDDPSDRRERYDRDDRYDDRRDRYDDRRDRYDDRRDRHGDRNDRYDDRRDRRDRDDDSDHYSERYDSRDRPPSVPPNKPKDLRH